MATKVTQGSGTNDAAGTTLAASAVAVLKGDVIACQVSFEAVAGAASFSDGSGNVYTQATTQDHSAVLFGRTASATVKVDNAALIVTAATPNGTFRRITVLVFRPATGLILVPRLSTSGQGTSTTLSSGAILSVAGASAAFYSWESGGTFTIGSGWTPQNSVATDTFDGYQLGTSESITGNATGTISTRWLAHVINFAELSAVTRASSQRSPNRRGAGRHFLQPSRKAYSAAVASANLTLAIDTPGTATFAGQSVAITLGLAFTNGSATFQGQAVNVSLSVPLTAGSATFQGQSVAFSTGLALAAGSATFAGQAVTTTLSMALAAGSATFEGQGVTLDLTTGGNLTLDVAPGSASFVGQPVSFTLTESTVQLGNLGPMSASIGFYDHRKRRKIADDADEIAVKSPKVVVSGQDSDEEEEAVMLFLMLH